MNLHRTVTRAVLILLANYAVQSIAAEPYLPRDNGEVLEVLPKSLISSELTTLRRKLSASNVNLASIVAGRYLSMGNLEGDPRFFGYARTARQPWWMEENPPAKILKLRAKLREKDHRYDDALVELRKLLAQESKNSQAWIEVANILRVQGKYDEAWEVCRSLEKFGGDRDG